MVRDRALVRLVWRESPLLIGISVSVYLCWWRGRAFVPMDWPGGFDWERYLRETWAYIHPGTMVSTWLEPLYPWLLSTLGTEIGWAWAGAVISSVAMIGMVCGTGLLGRALGGPWVGAAAAAAIPLTPQIVAGARWVNMYPLLAAGTAVGLGGAVALARWSRWWWAALAGLGIGLAWAVDTRTITLIPGVVLLAALGLQGVSGVGRKVVIAGIFLGGMSLGPVSHHQLRVMPREDAANVAVILRGIELSKIAQGSNEQLRAACEREHAEIINPMGLLSPCAAGLGRANAPQLDENLPYGLSLSLLFLCLIWLPGRGGRRQAVIAVLAVAPALVTTWAMSRWIILTPRYLMQIAPAAAVIGPLAIVQLARTLLPRRLAWLLSVAGCLGLLSWMWRGGPAARGVVAPLEHSSTYRMMVPVVREVRALVANGAWVLDCSESHIEVSQLPATLHSPPRNHEGNDWERCTQWIAQPEGQGDRYVVTGARTRVSGIDAHRLPRPWNREMHSEGMGQSIDLWRWGVEH